MTFILWAQAPPVTGYFAHLAKGISSRTWCRPAVSISSTIRISGSNVPRRRAGTPLRDESSADRGLKQSLDLGEVHDLVEFLPDFGVGHAQDRAFEIDISANGEFGVETGADRRRATRPRITTRPLGQAR